MDLRLVMFKASGQRKELSISRAATVIGRGEDCDLRIPIISVSRRHAELRISDAGIKIRDLGSSNGTYVNNQRINESDLKAGDRMAVGPIVFTVQINGEPEMVRPVKTRAQEKALTGVSEADEEIVDLEAEIVIAPAEGLPEPAPAESAVSAVEALASPPAPPADEPAEEKDEGDVISALEALAAESQDDEEEKPKS